MNGAANTPVVSIVMPFFNADDTIADAIGSVLGQTFQDWELLLIDDNLRNVAQDDSALSINDPRIHVLKTSGHVGAGPARNVGMAAAKGRYIAFLDADDMWHPQKLTLQIDAMQAADAVLSCTAFVRVNVMTGRTTAVGVPERFSRQVLLHTNLIACSSAVFDRDHFGEKEMPALRRRQDFAFWLTLLQDGSDVLGVPYPLLTYHERPNSLSAPRGQSAKDTWAMYYTHLGLPLWASVFYFSNYAVRGVVRRFAPSLARAIGWMHPVRAVPK